MSCLVLLESPSLKEALNRVKRDLRDGPVAVDIDDTVMFGGFDELGKEAPFEPNKPIVSLLKSFEREGRDIYFVTARSREVACLTRRHLHELGLDCKGLFITPERYRDSFRAVGEFKAKIRRMLKEKHGKPLSLTVGDQWTDIDAHWSPLPSHP
jgi:hypothetical protein